LPTGRARARRSLPRFGALAEKLEIPANDLKPRALLTALFVVPGVELETAFDEYTRALLQVLLSNFGEPRPKDNIKRKALPLFAPLQWPLRD
jgi:hypothetical protein